MSPILSYAQAKAVCDSVIPLAPVGGCPTKIWLTGEKNPIVVRIKEDGKVKVTEVQVGKKVRIRNYESLARFAEQHQEAA